MIITTGIGENGLRHSKGIWRATDGTWSPCYQLSFQVANSMEVARTTGGYRGHAFFICSHQKCFFAILNTKPTNIWNQPPQKKIPWSLS